MACSCQNAITEYGGILERKDKNLSLKLVFSLNITESSEVSTCFDVFSFEYLIGNLWELFILFFPKDSIILPQNPFLDFTDISVEACLPLRNFWRNEKRKIFIEVTHNYFIPVFFSLIGFLD